MLLLFVSAVLFFLLAPGTFFTLPVGSAMMTAAAHALLFMAVLFVVTWIFPSIE